MSPRVRTRDSAPAVFTTKPKCFLFCASTMESFPGWRSSHRRSWIPHRKIARTIARKFAGSHLAGIRLQPRGTANSHAILRAILRGRTLPYPASSPVALQNCINLRGRTLPGYASSSVKAQNCARHCAFTRLEARGHPAEVRGAADCKGSGPRPLPAKVRGAAGAVVRR